MLSSNFPGLRTSVASMTSTASFHKRNHWVLCFHQPWHQNYLSLSLNVEWMIKNSLFYWFWHPFSGKLWRPSMRPKLNLKDKGQMSKPNEYTDNFKSNFTCIFLSVRAKLKKPLCPRTLCKISKTWKLFCSAWVK